jgi:hypothetical protein
LYEVQIDDVPQVTEVENKVLIDIFTEMEVRAALFQMKHNKSPCADGFPIELYDHSLNFGIIKERYSCITIDSQFIQRNK